MKTYRTLAWKELKTEKITTILILIALILSSMMTTVIGQSIGILSSMRQQQASSLNGNRYASFHQLTEEQTVSLMGDSRLSYAEKLITVGTSEIPNSNFFILLREFEGNALSAYPQDTEILEGHLPEKAGEIALPQDVLSMLQFEGKPGDTIHLDARISFLRTTEQPYEYSYDFVLTGILKPNYLGYVSGMTAAVVGQGTAKELLLEKYHLYTLDIRTKEKNTFQNTIDDLAERFSIPDYCIQYNDVLLSAMSISYNTEKEVGSASSFPFIVLTCILVGMLVLLASGLVIYNILNIVVLKKVNEYGTLRAIGAERGKLYTLVSWQLAILCLIGIPLGTALGLVSAKGITTAAASFVSPTAFMADTPSEVAELIAVNAASKLPMLLASILVTIVFAFVAAFPAVRYAGKVSPTLAMAGKYTKIKRKRRKEKRIRNFEAFYARMNMKRNRGRTAITILSLVMSITVFIALQGFSGLLDASVSVQKMHLGDYSITNEAMGFFPKDVQNLKNLHGINKLSTLKFKLFLTDEHGVFKKDDNIEILPTLSPGETLQITGIDTERLRNLLPSLTDPDMEALKTGTACLIKNPIPISYENDTHPYTYVKAGDIIEINGKQLKVISEVDNPVTLDNAGFINGLQVIVYDMIFDNITGQSNYSELYPTLSKDADRENIEQTIDSLCQTTGGHFLSYEDTDQQLKESFEKIRLLAWGLIVLIGFIGILNIVNTVYTNIHTRIKEIGMQRAIGMCTGSLYKAFLWEGTYYGIIAAIIGSIAGYICIVFVNAATTDVLQLVAIPFLPIIVASILSITACLIATSIPLRKITKMSIVESIEAVE